MSAFLLTLTVLSFALMVAAILMGIRNGWVYKQRMARNKEHSDLVRRLIDTQPANPLVQNMGETWWDNFYLSYDQMMWRVWIWDIEKMRKP